MFEFLKRAVQVDLIDVNNRLLTFRCSRAQQDGKVLTIKFDIKVSDTHKKSFKLAVIIQSSRPHEKSHICVGEVLETRRLASVYDEVVQAAREAYGFSQRRKRRVPVRIRVLSTGLHGLSRDFNTTGMQLEVEADVSVGTELMLTLDMGSAMFPKALVPARVVWARNVARRKNLIGVEFGELAPALQYQLEEFERFLIHSQSGDIVKRQASDFDAHIKKLYPQEVSGPPADPAAPMPPAEA